MFNQRPKGDLLMDVSDTDSWRNLMKYYACTASLLYNCIYTIVCILVSMCVIKNIGDQECGL